MSATITIGRLGDAYGIKGWLHLISYTDPPENVFNYPHWQVNGREVFIEAHRPHGNHYAIKLKGCDVREQALLLKHRDILVDRAALPKLPPGEYYWSDLVGLSVQDTQGKLLGIVDHLFSTGANDVISVKNGQGIELLIPYLTSVVKQVDLDKKMIVVDWV